MGADGGLGDELLKQALAQGERVAALTTRASRLRKHARVRDADRALHTMQAAYTFRQGENLSQSLVFSVPKGQAFEAHRLSLFAELRIVSIQEADGDSEITFRPTVWTHNKFDHFGAGLQQAWPNAVDRFVDAQIELTQMEADGTTSHEYQNAPFPVAHTFSGGVNSDMVGSSLQSARPGALVFGVPMLLAAGTALQLRVTPLFSGVRTADDRLNEYRIVGVLEGFKRLSQ